MLDVTVKAHRAFLRAGPASGAGTQKLFVMVKLLPTLRALPERPRLDVAIVVDTSGSMSRPVRHDGPQDGRQDGRQDGHEGEPTKLQQAMAAVRALLSSELLHAEDRLALVHFDDEARVLASGGVGATAEQLLQVLPELTRRKGGTWMGLGLLAAARTLQGHQDAVRRVLLLTDGRAADEAECRRAARLLAARNTRIVAFGLGDEYNEDLLTELCALTLGTPHHLSDHAALPEVVAQEIGGAARQVIADARATVTAAQGVQVVSALRVYPTLADVERAVGGTDAGTDAGTDPTDPTAGDTLLLGSLEAGDHTIFLVELDVSPSPEGRACLARVGLSYRTPTQSTAGEVAPVDVVVEFTADSGLASAVDAEVMGYVQQRSVDRLIRQATHQAVADPPGAALTLQQARTVSQRIGNYGMVHALTRAEEELRATGAISQGTSKTIKVGARTQTIKS